jgi:amino acid adenylation domain-containing protein
MTPPHVAAHNAHVLSGLYREHYARVRLIVDFPGDRLYSPDGLYTGERLLEAPPRFLRDDLRGTIPDRFRRTVATCASDLAVKSRSHAWTYRQLDRAANCVAHAVMSASGTGPAPVALLFEHDAPVVAAMFGVLKAGKFYAALDRSFPLQRNKAILDDLAAPVLLCDRANLQTASILAADTCRLLVYEDLDDAFADDDVLADLSADSLFGVFYTSGSTGEPKGLPWPHKLPLHRVLIDIADAGIARSDRQTLLTSFGFAAAASDMYLPLLNGASLHLYDVRENGAAGLADWLRQEQITLIRSPIALFRQFVRALDERETFPSVRVIGLSGAAVFRDDIVRARPHFSASCRVIHRYTTSEGGMVARSLIDADTELDGPLVAAGYPAPGKHVVILDENRREVPRETVGEIAVSSRYLAHGYWREPEQTARRFIADTTDPGKMLCLTGDQGRMRADGCLELLGRADARVKIRGYRVELAAVEGALRELPGVGEAAVMAEPDASRELSVVAYMVPARGVVCDERALRRQLATTLPDYMLPSAFVLLHAMPLTRNGKIDRMRLASAQRLKPLSRPSSASRNGIERVLLSIWGDVLERKEIGVDDNFFDLGGHSLDAATVIARIHQTLRVSLLPRTIYDAPTVRALAAVIAARAMEGEAAGRNTQTIEDTRRQLGLD